MAERILLCLAHMSGKEMDFIKEAFADNWVVPLGPNVNGFEKDLENFVNKISPMHNAESMPNAQCPMPNDVDAEHYALKQHCALNKRVVALSAGTAAVHLALIACGVKPGDEVLVQSFTFCASSDTRPCRSLVAPQYHPRTS